MKILYFTATGNSLFVAKSFGSECYSIPQMIKEGKYDFEDDKIGIIFPIYYSGVPKIVVNFLSKAKLKGNYIFGIGTFGAFSGAAATDLSAIGKKNGIEFDYINDLLMIDNFLPGFDMDKECKKEPNKNIEQNLERIVQDVAAERKFIKKDSLVFKMLLKRIKVKADNTEFDRNFILGENCIQCKICEKVCPVNNIKVDTKPNYGHNCQMCLACVHHCPNNVISLKKEKGKSRYINKNTSLAEIIAANE